MRTRFLVILLVFACSKASSRMVNLPKFAVDYSEIFISAIIEKSFISSELYLTMILAGSHIFYARPQLPVLMVNRSDNTFYKWKKLAMTSHLTSTDLRDSDLFCQFKNLHDSADSAPVLSKGRLLIGSTTDSGFNKIMKILRCKISPPEIDLNTIRAGNKKSLDVNILRRTNISTVIELVSFSVPWATRFTGYGFSLSKQNSRWDPWFTGLSSSKKGGGGGTLRNKNKPLALITTASTTATRNLLQDIPSSVSSTTTTTTNTIGSTASQKKNPEYSQQQHSNKKKKSSPVIYAAVSTIRPSEPNRMMTGIPMLLEHLENNLHVGISHSFLSIHLDSMSVHFQRYRLALDPYILQGHATVSPLSYRGYDDVVGFEGLMLIEIYAEWLHQINCLYLAKGMADYLILLHAPDFITLRPSITSLPQLLTWAVTQVPAGSTSSSRSVLPSDASSSNLDGSSVRDINSDGSKKRQKQEQLACFYILESLGVPDPPTRSSRGPEDTAWSCDFYASSKQPIGPMPAFQTLILPTRNVWSVASRTCGACAPLMDVSDANVALATATANRTTEGGPSRRTNNRGFPFKRKHLERIPSSVWQVPPNFFANYQAILNEPIHNKMAFEAEAPWANPTYPVSDEGHGGRIGWDGLAVVYHYKGQFESFQLSRTKRSRNEHLDTVGSVLRDRLLRRGFRIENETLWMEASLESIRKRFPLAFDLGLVLRKAGDSTTWASGASLSTVTSSPLSATAITTATNPMDRGLVWVRIGCRFEDLDALSKRATYAAAATSAANTSHIIAALTSMPQQATSNTAMASTSGGSVWIGRGEPSLKAQGTWLECQEEARGCRYFADILVTSS